MTVNRTTLLDLPLPVTGTESGTWGDTTNNGLTQYMDIAIAGMSNLTSANFTAGALTIETTEGTSSATNITATSAQYAGFRVTSLATNSTITVGNTGTSPARSYRLINADSTYTLTFKATGQTGVTLQPGQSAVVAFNGTDYVFIGAVGPGSSLNTPLAVVGNATAGAEIRLPEDTDNGSNYVALKAPDTLASNLTFTLPSADGSSGQTITTNGSGTLSFGTLGVAGGGTGATTLTGVLKGNGTSAFTAATAGTDYVAPATATTFTATQTFSGSSSAIAAVLTNTAEVCTVSATAATGTINYDVTTQSVLYYTSNASANWTVNFRGSSGTSLNTLMSTGQSLTVAFLVTQGSTAYYNSAVQVDGASVTPKWQGGTAPTSGNASSIDVYSYTIIKTGSAAFTVLASQTKFA